MKKPSSLLLLHLLLFLTTSLPLQISSFPEHYLRKTPSTSSSPSSPDPSQYQQYFELTHPLPSDQLTPSCTLHVIRHTFGNTINQRPYSTPYSPPSNCSSPWRHVTLELRTSSIGNQYDRISALWLGGAELLRTSTAEPTEDGVYWSVRKDITRYSSLLKQNDLNFTLMLENIVNDVFTAAYRVDVTLFFYKTVSLPPPLLLNNHLALSSSNALDGKAFKAKVDYETPADLIIPISAFRNERGHWFRIEDESDVHYTKLRIPRNTYKVVLELYVSFHGNDEFWYSNPSNAYIRMNNLTTQRGNGAFREVFVTIDGMFVDSEIPFPVIFTGGINPLFWDPTVAIGAFDLPTYDFDLTPFLGILLDGKDHVIGLGVGSSISYWLVDGNLHLWLDKTTARVTAKSVIYQNPGSSIKQQESFRMLDGSLAIKGKRQMKLVGWVKSGNGNVTVSVSHSYKFKNFIRFTKQGTFKQVKQTVTSSRELQILDELGFLLSLVTVKRRYPLKVATLTLPGAKDDMYRLYTNVSHAMVDKIRVGTVSSSVHNKQICIGWMDVKDHDVLSGKAWTNQTLTTVDDSGCYVRSVVVIDGSFLKDNSTDICPSVV